MRLRAADAGGGPDAVDRAWRDARAAVSATDPLDEPDDDTVALYHHLVAARSATQRSPSTASTRPPEGRR